MHIYTLAHLHIYKYVHARCLPHKCIHTEIINIYLVVLDKDRIADLENKIEEQKMEIENHIRVITILETRK